MRQTIHACTLVLLALGLAPVAAQAQDYPVKPIRMILPIPPGGGMDVAARLVGQKLGDLLGQDIVIEYRPGANGLIGSEEVAKAAPDGYTLLFFDDDLFTIPALMPQMTFDPTKELVPITTITSTPLTIFANADAPFNTISELLDRARAEPAGLAYATPGLSLNHVVMQWVAVEAHVKLLGVPYRGGAECALAVLSGNLPVGIVSPSSIFPGFTGAGKLKVIALTGAQRPSFAPSSWPTLTENGLPIDASLRLGLFAPSGIPDAIVSRLDRAVASVLQDDAVRKRMTESGLNPVHMGHAAYAEALRTEAARYDQITRQAGIRVEQ